MLTLFDIIALALLAISGGVGFYRGGVREMVNVLALIAAALVAVFALPVFGPFGRQLVQPAWAGNAAAAIVTFLVIYISVRVLGGELARRIQATEVLGLLDRSIGLGFGLIRALIVLGAFNLAFNAATPSERIPRWMSGAALYPLTTTAAKVLKTFAPKGLDMADKLKPAIADAVQDSNRAQGYDARDRGGIDDLVEKSR